MIYVLIAIFGVIIFVTNWFKKINSDGSSTTYYLSHCWKCGSGIDSSQNTKCSYCNKYYRCTSCGSCLCEKRSLSKRKKADSYEWKPVNNNSEYRSTSYYKKSSKRKNKTISQSGYGYCNRCGKKLRGNKAKPLCYACWSSGH